MRVLYMFPVVLLAACATHPAQRDADNLALYNTHSGAPVDQFRYFGRMTQWVSLGDQALAVWTRPSEAWLLDLSGPCPDLEFAQAIGLSSTVNTVSARFDKVTVLGGGAHHIPCQIARIRPIDVDALRAEQRELRQQERAQPSGT